MKPFFIVIISLTLVSCSNQPKPPITAPAQTTTTQSNSSLPSPTPFTPYTVTFNIITNGTTRTFAASMYHHQSNNAYLTAQNPNQIHIQKPNITWQDFFNTLPFSLDQTCLTTGTGQTFCSNDTQKLTFTLNGQPSPNVLDQTIQPGNHLTVNYQPR